MTMRCEASSAASCSAVSAASASADGPRAFAAKTSDEQTTIAIARQARLVMTALRSIDVDSLAALGASGIAAPNARTVERPQTRVIGPSIALGKSKLSSEIVQGGASLWRRRSYLSAFVRRPADAWPFSPAWPWWHLAPRP